MAPPRKAAASIQALDPLALPNWDSLVASLPGHTFFHSAAWARTLVASYGYKPTYFAKLEDGALRALLPLMGVNSWLTGKRGVSLPFTDACEALTVDERAAREVFEAACAHGRRKKWKYIEVRGSVGESNEQRCGEFYDHVLRLSNDPQQVFAGFESSVRRAIRKAEKSGPTVEISRTLESVQEFYDLHCQTRQKHGVPPQPFSFFEAFHRNVIAANHGIVVVVRYERKPIAASVFVHTGKKAIYKYGASDERFQNFRGANLAMWHAIQWYASRGFSEFGFGRTDKSNEGLRRYKLGWGSEERGLAYSRFDLKRNRFIEAAVESSQFRERVFRFIPIPMARMIGSVLYRHAA
jgi:hypothetical protein